MVLPARGDTPSDYKKAAGSNRTSRFFMLPYAFRIYMYNYDKIVTYLHTVKVRTFIGLKYAIVKDYDIRIELYYKRRKIVIFFGVHQGNRT